MIDIAQSNDTGAHFLRLDLLPKVVGVDVKNCDKGANFSFGYRSALTKRCGLTTRTPLRCISGRTLGSHSFAFVRPSGMTPLDFRTALVLQAAVMLTWGEPVHVRDFDKAPSRNPWMHGPWLEVRDFSGSVEARKYIELLRSFSLVEFDNLDRARPLRSCGSKTSTPHFPDRWMEYGHAFLKRHGGSFDQCKYQLQKDLVS